MHCYSRCHGGSSTGSYATRRFPAKVGPPLRSLQTENPDAIRPSSRLCCSLAVPRIRHPPHGPRYLHRPTPRHHHPHPLHAGHGLEEHRPHPRRPFRCVDRGRRRRPDLLLRRDRWRCVEDNRRRHHVDERERRPFRDRLGRRGRGGRVGPERGVGRDGRTRGAWRHHLARKRRVPLDRRRAKLDPHGARGHARHFPCPDPPRRSRHRLRRRPGCPLRRDGGPRHLPDHGRWPELGEGAVRLPPRRGGRSGHGHDQPPHPLRLLLGSSPAPLGRRVGRRGERPLEVDGRRRHLGADQRGAAGSGREDRRHRLTRQPGPSLCGRGGGAGPGRRLPVRRRGRFLAADERGTHRPDPLVVLHEDLRRPAGRRDGVRHERAIPQVDRRRPQLHPGLGAPRRQSPPLDQPRQRGQHDQLQRRGRERLLQRGR